MYIHVHFYLKKTKSHAWMYMHKAQNPNYNSLQPIICVERKLEGNLKGKEVKRIKICMYKKF